ncbi:uncharacterized protein LOC130801918 isoform X1 [Amaranthus tricolor]|uniref:uncharacterized protein LOC130801918 isoform X1 n=2 Tax=Amaranthus tricolor TaxID=29722 RepID=UPI00258A18C5|nr:uncharacterized protein LOC130801918 isoform X1 [Amaranthus tricolor]XP_057521847.1 uncharacterized protein LOC130801918 isoform X1 [Amaranthus tricolor]
MAFSSGVFRFVSPNSEASPILSSNFRLKTGKCDWINSSKKKNLQTNCCLKMNSKKNGESKLVWIWTENKQVMTTAVERGWQTFIFDVNSRDLAKDWSSIALINPLFFKDGALLDMENRSVASFFEISSPQHLDQVLLVDESQNTVIHLLDWQVIPAENIVAAIQGNGKRVLAVAETVAEAQNFLEAVEHGLGGVVLKVQDIDPILQLKEYLDRKSEARNCLTLTKATVNLIRMAGMGDRVCVDLCSIMNPGEGLLVGSFARGLFLVHSECLETDYIASRPFRVNAGPVHSYVAVPGGKTCYLSELKAGKEVLVVDQNGQQRTAIVGRVKIETRLLILVEAKENSSGESFYSILLQNAETVGFVSPLGGHGNQRTVIPVTSLKVGDEILLRKQGGARHTGIEIQEFIVEK